jgi:deazaflavin-dependent oxidoreductase (nitroreductase family)
MPFDLRRRITITFQKWVANPLSELVPLQTVLEATGRKSGQLRQTPVVAQVVGNQLWLISEFGHKSQYVRNIKANPRVRVQLDGKWRSGTAHLLPDDDAHARLRALPQTTRPDVEAFGTELLTVRIDLDN